MRTLSIFVRVDSRGWQGAMKLQAKVLLKLKITKWCKIHNSIVNLTNKSCNDLQMAACLSRRDGDIYWPSEYSWIFPKSQKQATCTVNVYSYHVVVTSVPCHRAVHVKVSQGTNSSTPDDSKTAGVEIFIVCLAHFNSLIKHLAVLRRYKYISFPAYIWIYPGGEGNVRNILCIEIALRFSIIHGVLG